MGDAISHSQNISYSLIISNGLIVNQEHNTSGLTTNWVEL